MHKYPAVDDCLIKETLSDGSYWEMTYQDAERKIKRVRKDSSHQTLSRESYSFDRRGNAISYTDGQNKTFTRQYDKLNRLKVEIAPGETPEAAQPRTNIAYNGNTVTITNTQGEKRTLTQDAWNRTTRILAQDANNQEVSETTYTYTPDSITETKGSVNTTTTFDPFGNPISVDRIDSEEGIGTQIWNATLGSPRVQGGLMLAGGIGEMLVGGVLWVIPDPTLLTKVGGGALIGHGADMAAASWNQMWTGQTTQTFTAQGVSKGLQSVGVPPYYASTVGSLTEIGVAAMPVAVVAKVGTAGRAGVKALHEVPALTVADVAFKKLPEGSFSVVNWTGYPASLPKPMGPMLLLPSGSRQLLEAQRAKVIINNELRKAFSFRGVAGDIHEIQPVKFGGSPTDLSNKLLIPRDLHQQAVTPFWNQLQRNIESIVTRPPGS